MKRLFFLLLAAAMPLFALTSYRPDFASIEGTATATARFQEEQKLVLKKFDDGRPYLELRRGAKQPRLELARPIGDKEDFGYSMTYTRLMENSTACFGFKTSGEEYSGLLWVQANGNVCIRNSNENYESVGVNIPPNVPTRIAVSVSRQRRVVTVRVGDGKPYECDVPIPEAPLQGFAFSQQPPEGNVSAVSDFELHYGAARVQAYQNIAPECACAVEASGDVPASAVEFLADQELETHVLLPEKCTLLYALPQPATVTSVQLFGGRPGVADYPSGACSPKHYVVEGFADGAWKTLAEVADAPEICLNYALSPEELFVLTEFPPARVEKLRIRFIESHDTGNRMTGPIEAAARSMHLREVQIFTDQKAAPPRFIRALVKCDWRLSFYRNAEAAQLYLEVAEVEPPVESIHMEIADPDGQVIRTEDIPVHAGVNVHTVAGIGDWKPGRYMTTLSLDGSTCRRLLRLERVPEVAPAVEPMAMGAGRKIFFTPDDYVLSECEGAKVEVVPVRRFHQFARTPDDADFLICLGNDYYRTPDGQYGLKVSDRHLNFAMVKGDRTRWLLSDSPTGPFAQVDKAPARAARPAFTREFVRADFREPPVDAEFSFFDPKTDGAMDLRTVRYKYTYAKTEFGKIATDGRQGTWIYGRTVDGKWVLPHRKALLDAFNTFGEDCFDTGFECNDNFGDSWLSPDGKTLYMAIGQTVRRCAPFAVPYDNLPQAFRIMTIYSTQDGVAWKNENTVVPPDEGDSFGAQHYGAMRLPFAQGDLTLMYIYNYDSEAQQIYIDLAYSRDNLHFHRFPNAPAFARGTDPMSSWFYGHVFAGHNILQDGDSFLQPATYCTPLPHFTGELIARHKDRTKVTAADVERIFARRGLAERWPFFKAIGGYEGIAALVRDGYYANGAMEFRAYGWFGLKAGAGEGRFTTRRMTGGRRLTANAECGPGGFVEIEAVDAATGRRLAIARLDGDGIAQPLFMLPPTQEYFLRGRMKSAILYTLDFAE